MLWQYLVWVRTFCLNLFQDTVQKQSKLCPPNFKTFHGPNASNSSTKVLWPGQKKVFYTFSYITQIVQNQTIENINENYNDFEKVRTRIIFQVTFKSSSDFLTFSKQYIFSWISIVGLPQDTPTLTLFLQNLMSNNFKMSFRYPQFFQKTNKNWTELLRLNFFVCFSGEFEDTKKTFRN